MDDIYIAAKTKEELHKLQLEIEVILREKLRLEMNKKKTYITKSTRGIVYMQQKYRTVNGKLVITPVPKKFTRERRKLKAYNRCLYRGEITALDITFWYKSWRNGILKGSKCRRSVFAIDKYFHTLYDNIVQINNKCYKLKEKAT